MARVAKPQRGEPITLVFTQSGTPRYRVVLDADPDPATGKRRQVRSTHDSLSDARKAVQKHKVDRSKGLLLDRSKVTFREYADEWLAARGGHVRQVTLTGYKTNVETAKASFGSKRLNAVTRADVEALVSGMAKAGRSQRTTSLLLFVLRSVFERARDEGLIYRNPAQRVKPAGSASRGREALSSDDLARLRKHLADDPLYAGWLLTLYGMRRSEVLGLRWSDVNLPAGTLSINRGRVAVDGKNTAENDPKTSRGKRTLPLSGELSTALRALRKHQLSRYGSDQARTGYVVMDDDSGKPMRPERWSDLWKRHCKAAAVPALTLHSARHSSVTVMRNAGVPDHVVAAFHGHDEAVMQRVYSHTEQKQLSEAAETLTGLLTSPPKSPQERAPAVSE